MKGMHEFVMSLNVYIFISIIIYIHLHCRGTVHWLSYSTYSSSAGKDKGFSFWSVWGPLSSLLVSIRRQNNIKMSWNDANLSSGLLGGTVG